MDDGFTAFSSPDKRYVFEKQLGTGGMGIVRQMYDRALGRSVAMKQLKGDHLNDESAVVTLVTEARIAGMLEHPNIIPVYDSGTLSSGEPFYTMRLMDAMSLQDVLQWLRSRSPEAERKYTLVHMMRILVRVCMAVDYAHSQGVIHRDLKPDNIRLGRFGEVQVADWGLARRNGFSDVALERALKDSAEQGDSDPCIVIGSPNYMSPEQACGLNDEIDHTTDIYSMGCTLYEIITLAAPHEDEDTMVLLDMVELDDVIPPSERAPERMIPPALERICMECLVKDPKQRVQDMRILIRALEEYIEGHRQAQISNERAFSEIQRGQRYSDAYARLREARVDLRVSLETCTDVTAARHFENQLNRVELESAVAWNEANSAYTRALGFDNSDLVARAKLAELAYDRLLDTEAEGDDTACQLYWSMLRRHNDGAYDAYVVGCASIVVQTAQKGATVYLKSYIDLDAGFDQGQGKAVGRTPFTDDSLPAGLYLVTVELLGFREHSQPVFLHAGANRVITVDLESL